MNDLPGRWATANLESCVDILDSQRIPVNSDERVRRKGAIPYYGATGQVGWIDDFLFDEELLLIGEDGAPFFDKSKAISYIIKGKSWINNHAHVLRALQGLTTNGFLKHYLNQFDFAGYVNGTTRLKLTQGSLKAIPVKIPPYDEQRRILAKLEKLLEKVDACKERLEKIPTILKRFRQSVLAAATLGKLTGDFASDRAGSEKSPVQLANVLFKVVTGPFGSSLHKADYVTGGIPVVNPMHINRGAITPSPEMAVSLKKAEQLSDFGLRAGDVVIARRGAMGRCAVVQPNQQGWLCGTGSMVLRTTPTLMPEYLQLFLSAPAIIEALEADAVGSTMVNLNQRIMLSLPILLPSVSEQHEIVRRVEALFKIAADIEKRYNKAKAHIDKLTQSILAKAFRGGLVPQDPNDEPASELLKRIQEERKKEEAEGSPGRRGSKRRVNTINPAE